MANVESFGPEDVALGLSVEEVQSVARRQLIGSLVVAIVIAVATGLTALRPAYRDGAEVAAHRAPVVQQPSFAAPTGPRYSVAKRDPIELP